MSSGLHNLNGAALTNYLDRFCSINRTFDRHVKKMNLQVDGTKLRFHYLRHITASWLNDKGVPLDTIRHILDHDERDTKDRYTTPDLRAYGACLDLLPQLRKVS